MAVVVSEANLKEEEDFKKAHPEVEEHPKFLFSNIGSLEFMLPEEHKNAWSPRT